jgi:hypothetical protein
LTAIEEFLVDPSEPTGLSAGAISDFVYRYTGTDGLAYTLETEQLRLNAWSSMNDPRETKNWVATGPIHGVGPLTDDEVLMRLDDVLRRSARLLALSQDREPESDAVRPLLLHRGWARAAMWDRYAQGHHGACLVLDRIALNETTGMIPAVDGRYTAWGTVAYEDEPINIPISGTFTSIGEVDDAIDKFLSQRWAISRLHMTKNRDWHTETEVRLAMIDLRLPEREFDTPLYIPVRDAIKAVILGSEYPAPRLIAEGTRKLLGTHAPEFFECTWHGGVPKLTVLP